MIRAAKERDVGVVKYLIPYYEKENLLGEMGDNYTLNVLMMTAYEIKNDEICKMLITTFSSCDSLYPLTACYVGRNALTLSVLWERKKVVQQLVHVYKDKNLLGELDGNGRNALMEAAYFGHLELLDILLPHFQEKNLIYNLNNKKQNLIDIAREKKREDVVEHLKPLFEEHDHNDKPLNSK